MASFHGIRFVSRSRDQVTLMVPWGLNATTATDEKRGSSSPGTSTLVHGADKINASMSGDGILGALTSGTADDSIKASRQGNRVKFRILYTLAFTSDRKRMSVVVEFPDGTVKLITKGADNVIKKRASGDAKVNSASMWQATEAHLTEFSKQGLRVMLLAQKTLTAEEINKWGKAYEIAAKSFSDESGNRQHRLDALADELENDLRILGVTAIEDKLQEGVPHSLRLLKNAGMKVWVLTGDKQNTAVNIGKSCGLIGSSYQLCHLRVSERVTCAEQLDRIIADLASGKRSQGAAFMISGDALRDAMAHSAKLLDVINHPRCRVVIASRMSPRQKASIVSLVKRSLGVVTLAVGDGANDVSMIRAAHVGVGLRGKEGMQAANSADFAVSKFRHLTQLLLVHGTLSYKRNSNLIAYFFYKNILIAVQQVFFLFFSGYSSEEVFDGWLLNTFNLCWTALPILLFSVFDRPANLDELITFPQLYLRGLRRKDFNFKRFWLMYLEAVVHGSILWLMTWHTLHDTLDSYWACSVATYTTVVIVANTKMAMITTTWYWFNILVLSLTLLCYFGAIFLYCGSIGFGISPWMFGIIGEVMKQPMFYLNAVWLASAVALQSFIASFVIRYFKPSLLMLVQEVRGNTPAQQDLQIRLGQANGDMTGKDSFVAESGPKTVRAEKICEPSGILRAAALLLIPFFWVLFLFFCFF